MHLVTRFLSGLILLIPHVVLASPIGNAARGGTSIEWQLTISGHQSVVLTVSAPNGEVWSREFQSGSAVSLNLKDLKTAEDGRYNYQLLVIPRISPEVKQQLQIARAAGDEATVRSIRKAAGIGAPIVQNGAFTVREGMIVSPSSERFRPRVDDQVIADDLIVDGKACVGSDCFDGMAFGTELLRLQSFNVRLRFEDTSVPDMGNAVSDWQLTVNDSTGSDVERFSIEDLTEGTTPFTILGGAPTNTIFADSFGRVGIGTSIPSFNLQVSDGLTPRIALERNTSEGFQHQTWAIQGTDNFAIADWSNDNLVFEIQAGAPDASMLITDEGHVGVGVDGPKRALHVVDWSAPENTVFEIQNSGPTRMRIRNFESGETWNIGHQSPSGTGLVYSDVGDAVSEMLLDISGNMTIAGTLTQGSSREIKKNFDSLDPAAVLEGVRGLAILTWMYKEGETARHVGPMAEEFHATFGFGIDDKHIAPSDQAGVALAAIQALAAKNDQLESRIEELETFIQELRCQPLGN